MAEPPRFTINRSLVVLRGKQPFLDWLREVDPKPETTLTLAEVQKDSEAFLIPDDDPITGPEEAVHWVEKRWRELFEHALMEWVTDESLWPRRRTLNRSGRTTADRRDGRDRV